MQRQLQQQHAKAAATAACKGSSINKAVACKEDMIMWLGTSRLELRVQADNSILEYNSCTHVVIASRHILASDVQPVETSAETCSSKAEMSKSCIFPPLG